MRRIITVAAMVAMAAALPAPAAHEGRTVEGTIVAPTVNQPLGLVTRHQRCAWLLAGSNGVFGHTVELTSDENDGVHNFTLTAEGADPTIAFYESLGTCDNAPAPSPNPAITFDNPGAESGSIPPDSNFAIIVIQGGANASFTFTIE